MTSCANKGWPMDPYDFLIVAILLGVPLLYLVLQVLTVTRWRGGFRSAAMIPPLLWALWIAVFVHDVTRDPTSHNLFPFEILIGALLSLVYLTCLKLAHWLMAGRSG